MERQNKLTFLNIYPKDKERNISTIRMRKPPDLLHIRAENRKQVMSCSYFLNIASDHMIY